MTDRPAKKKKSCPALEELPALLVQLGGGKALDPAVIAAIGEATSTSGSGGDPGTASATTIDKLFADHVGKSPDVVVGNALRHAQEQFDLEIDIFNARQRRTFSGDERAKIYNHPENRSIKGPKPNCRVWVDMFLGEEMAEELMKGTVPLNEDCPHDKSPKEGVIAGILKERKDSPPPTLELLANVLRYTKNEARKVSIDELMKFAVLYGLDGVMKDILKGCYGDVGDLSVNTLLPLDDEPIPPEGFRVIYGGRKVFMPPYAIGAILGHTNVATTALAHPEGNFDAAWGVQFKKEEGVKVHDDHQLHSQVFFWIFSKNMPEMIACLVKDCGFQFRWIDHERHIPQIIERLFETQEYESSSKWKGDVDEDDLMWECSRDRRRMRAASSYKEQMKMLDHLISLGFPFSLLFPVGDIVEREEALGKEKKSREECKAYVRNLSREDRNAREAVYMACSSYNSIQESEPKTLTLGDYYRKLKSRWDVQESAQTEHLPQYEELDSRWRATRREGNDDEQYESDSYRDSDDGSSYGDPPWM
ncbi:hypothetical protein THAOC_14694 [Thalassiosira oceanica]|uniref:Uncharacterized protein n=2 Tax=Thalassiosira oceanica TaxID=159749 RepID=K0SU90_THAOC|nr:hypothetical protein THAOC_14694 [Thalassiosira oceanica]|eukprot:EJK64561.1 hypothetical protein THAOC_14694 [Thalassiosira oceanica]